MTLVFTNIVGFSVEGESGGVVIQTLDTSRVRVPILGTFEIEGWPALCAEVRDSGQPEKVIPVTVTAPFWIDEKSPVVFNLNWTIFETGQMPPNLRWLVGAHMVPGWRIMTAWVPLDTVAVWTVFPGQDQQAGYMPPSLCVTGTKESDGTLSMDLRFFPGGPLITPSKIVRQIEPFLSAEWPSGGPVRACLYPNRVPGQEAGVIALATDEKERRIVLCYAADTAWLGPVLAIMNSKQ